MTLAAAIVACMTVASQMHALPQQMLFTMLHVEGGRVGQFSRNTNGTIDIGPMQINSIWLESVAARWRIDRETALHRLLYDPCLNIETGAWILRERINATGDVLKGVAAYHSSTPRLGAAYLTRFVAKARFIDANLSSAGIGAAGDFTRAIANTPITQKQGAGPISQSSLRTNSDAGGGAVLQPIVSGKTASVLSASVSEKRK